MANFFWYEAIFLPHTTVFKKTFCQVWIVDVKFKVQKREGIQRRKEEDMKSVSWNWRRKYFDETFHSVYILCVHSCVIWNIVHKNKEYILVHRQLWYWFSIKDWSGEHVTCACFEETVRRHWVLPLPAWEESTVAVIRILNWGLSAPRCNLKLPGTSFFSHFDSAPPMRKSVLLKWHGAVCEQCNQTSGLLLNLAPMWLLILNK